MNKVLARVVMGAVLLGGGAVQADTDENQQLMDCREQLASIYGEDVRVRISGRTAVSDPTLKLLVYPKGERLLRISCVRSSDGELDMLDRYGMALVMPGQHTEKLTAM